MYMCLAKRSPDQAKVYIAIASRIAHECVIQRMQAMLRRQHMRPEQHGHFRSCHARARVKPRQADHVIWHRRSLDRSTRSPLPWSTCPTNLSLSPKTSSAPDNPPAPHIKAVSRVSSSRPRPLWLFFSTSIAPGLRPLLRERNENETKRKRRLDQTTIEPAHTLSLCHIPPAAPSTPILPPLVNYPCQSWPLKPWSLYVCPALASACAPLNICKRSPANFI
jgi:hypothetical protein